MPVKPIPDGYRGVTPYLSIDGAARAIEFYKQAFGAVETMRLDAPDGKIAHAEIRVGDSPIMLADEVPQLEFRSPRALGGTPVLLHLYVEDADAAVDRAVRAGATLKRAVGDQFYGDRGGSVVDPFGHSWWFATRREDLSAEEIDRRARAMYSGKP